MKDSLSKQCALTCVCAQKTPGDDPATHIVKLTRQGRPNHSKPTPSAKQLYSPAPSHTAASHHQRHGLFFSLPDASSLGGRLSSVQVSISTQRGW